MKGIKIIYWVTTALLSLMMLFSAGMYIFANSYVAEIFTNLGWPTFIIYPLAVAKVFGVVAILGIKNRTIKEWAYAGFFFVLVLGVASHIMIGDGGSLPAFVTLVITVGSYISGKKLKYI